MDKMSLIVMETTEQIKRRREACGRRGRFPWTRKGARQARVPQAPILHNAWNFVLEAPGVRWIRTQWTKWLLGIRGGIGLKDIRALDLKNRLEGSMLEPIAAEALMQVAGEDRSFGVYQTRSN